MEPPHCKINFNNDPQGVFHSGEMLSGSVELRLNHSMLVDDFRLVISGYAEVEWIVRKSKDHKVTYAGKEKLLLNETALIPPNYIRSEIPAGIHVFNFVCPIPLDAPSSYEGDHGKIRYTVQAILDRPWKFDQIRTFTVLKPLDLNQYIDSLKVRQEKNLVKTFCCWPCASRPLFIEVEIPMSGYVPGQSIPISVSLNNASITTVQGIESSLKRIVSYISQYPKPKSWVIGQSLASVWTSVTHHEPATYSQELEIPSIPPSGKCSVLAIDYILKVKVHVVGMHLSPKIKLPITIGTIPFAPVPTITVTPHVNFGWTYGITTLPTAPELPSPSNDAEVPPPSYEEALDRNGTSINDVKPNAVGLKAYNPRDSVCHLERQSND
ncbi:arrestin domain-containing protein 2-like [Armigeres subalbatus]|uniref:arrestin domain-containing protein 2-like n=1 Tax=Armigeres subalbatus TaxID=124917 RepID=UPI002ED1178A